MIDDIGVMRFYWEFFICFVHSTFFWYTIHYKCSNGNDDFMQPEPVLQE